MIECIPNPESNEISISLVSDLQVIYIFFPCIRSSAWTYNEKGEVELGSYEPIIDLRRDNYIRGATYLNVEMWSLPVRSRVPSRVFMKRKI